MSKRICAFVPGIDAPAAGGLDGAAIADSRSA